MTWTDISDNLSWVSPPDAGEQDVSPLLKLIGQMPPPKPCWGWGWVSVREDSLRALEERVIASRRAPYANAFDFSAGMDGAP